MVSPITGPFHTFYDSPTLWTNKTWYRQKRPYSLALNFGNNFGWVSKAISDVYAGRWANWAHTAFTTSHNAAYAKAYSRVVDSLGETAGLGIDLAQWREADAMIRSRGRQLLAFNSALMRRSPLGVAASLGISLRKVQAIMGTRYGVARSLSNLWLEFWFGWKPLVSDIYSGCEVFNQDIPMGRQSGSSSLAVDYLQDDGSPYSEHVYWRGYTRCRVGMNVKLVNPNIRLLQSFGLLNPLAVAWDAVPWSFVVDWFTNCSSWLGSFTDFAGLETSAGYLSFLTDVKGHTWWPAYPEQESMGGGVFVSRESFTYLPAPRLQFKQDLSIRPTRALTAISLLVQKLPK